MSELGDFLRANRSRNLQVWEKVKLELQEEIQVQLSSLIRSQVTTPYLLDAKALTQNPVGQQYIVEILEILREEGYPLEIDYQYPDYRAYLIWDHLPTGVSQVRLILEEKYLQTLAFLIPRFLTEITYASQAGKLQYTSGLSLATILDEIRIDPFYRSQARQFFLEILTRGHVVQAITIRLDPELHLIQFWWD